MSKSNAKDLFHVKDTSASRSTEHGHLFMKTTVPWGPRHLCRTIYHLTVRQRILKSTGLAHKERHPCHTGHVGATANGPVLRPMRAPPPPRTTRGHRLQPPGTKQDAELKSSVTPAAPHVLSRLASTASPTANPHPGHPGTSRPALPWGPATAPCKCVCLDGAHQQVDASLRGGHASRTSPRPGLSAVVRRLSSRPHRSCCPAPSEPTGWPEQGLRGAPKPWGSMGHTPAFLLS